MELFSRMVENLISNSIRHNPKGCSICISFRKSARKGKYEIIISDDGVGANKEQFRYFNKKLCESSQKLGEHGIGLRVVKQIVAYHNWKIHFEANENGGGFKTQIILCGLS